MKLSNIDTNINIIFDYVYINEPNSETQKLRNYLKVKNSYGLIEFVVDLFLSEINFRAQFDEYDPKELELILVELRGDNYDKVLEYLLVSFDVETAIINQPPNKSKSLSKKFLDIATQKLRDEIEALDYQCYVSKSVTSFGISNYVFVGDFEQGDFDSATYPKKIRLSDHGVSNFDRITNEIHVHNFENFSGIINQLNYYFRTSEYFDKRNIVEEELKKNFQTKELRDTDIVTKQWVTKKGESMYEVSRMYYYNVEAYFFKNTDIKYDYSKEMLF